MRQSNRILWHCGPIKLEASRLRGLVALVLSLALRGNAFALPTVVTGGDVHIYATFPTTVGGISFDTADVLYAGNYNDNNPPNGPANIWQIDPTDSSVTACGSPVDDPDAIYVDINGILGNPGDVLVGGVFGQGGHVSSFSNCAGPTLLTTDSCIANVTEFAEDESGRLYVCNSLASGATICVFDSVVWSTFLQDLARPWIAIDGLDIYVSQDQNVEKYDSGGNVIDSSFTRGLARAIGPPDGPFAGVMCRMGFGRWPSGSCRRRERSRRGDGRGFLIGSCWPGSCTG